MLLGRFLCVSPSEGVSHLKRTLGRVQARWHNLCQPKCYALLGWIPVSPQWTSFMIGRFCFCLNTLTWPLSSCLTWWANSSRFVSWGVDQGGFRAQHHGQCWLCVGSTFVRRCCGVVNFARLAVFIRVLAGSVSHGWRREAIIITPAARANHLALSIVSSGLSRGQGE